MIPGAARSCIAKVSGAKLKGMGFLVDHEHILTCAHVGIIIKGTSNPITVAKASFTAELPVNLDYGHNAGD
jgi:hypothetical protein